MARLGRHGGAAGVVVLEDARRRPGELADQPQCAVEVEQVVVRELLAVAELRGRQVGPGGLRLDIEARPAGGGSRRIAAAGAASNRRSSCSGNGVGIAWPASSTTRLKIIGDRLVVTTGRAEGRQREPAPIAPASSRPCRRSAAIKAVVLVGAGQDGDVRVVLGRRADQAWARRCRCSRSPRPRSRPAARRWPRTDRD